MNARIHAVASIPKCHQPQIESIEVIEQESSMAVPEVLSSEHEEATARVTLMSIFKPNSSEIESYTEHANAPTNAYNASYNGIVFETPDKTLKHDCAINSIIPCNTPM